MQKHYKSIQVFKNPFLERLTHVNPIVPLLVWAPIVGWLIWDSLVIQELNPWAVGSIGVFALVIWTLIEYVLHRFVFHFEMESQLGQKIHFLIHGLHHSDPVDPTRLVMPPAASLFIAAILYPFFRIFLGPVWVEPFFAFFVVGYLCYDYIHYSVHHFKPRTRIGRYLKNSHMQHHFVDQNSRWGVSSPFWDLVFGTLDGVKKKEQAIS